jgi:hypothetical protein
MEMGRGKYGGKGALQLVDAQSNAPRILVPPLTVADALRGTRKYCCYQKIGVEIAKNAARVAEKRA